MQGSLPISADGLWCHAVSACAPAAPLQLRAEFAAAAFHGGVVCRADLCVMFPDDHF